METKQKGLWTSAKHEFGAALDKMAKPPKFLRLAIYSDTDTDSQ